MSNAKNLNAKSNARIKDVKCLTAQNVLLFANNLIVLLIAKLLNPNANLYAKNLNAIGNATNQTAPSLNASWFAKILIAFPKLNAALVL